MSHRTDLEYLRSLNKKDLTNYLTLGWLDDGTGNPLYIIITNNQDESFQHIIRTLGEKCCVDLLITKSAFLVPMIFWIMFRKKARLEFLMQFSAKELERLMMCKCVGTSLIWMVTIQSIGGANPSDEVVIMYIYQQLGERKCIDGLLCIGFIGAMIWSCITDADGNVSSNTGNLPIFISDLSNSELERLTLTRSTLGVNNLFLFMLLVSPVGLAELRDRLGAARLVNSLIQQRYTSDIISSVITNVLNAISRKVKADVNFRSAKGIPDISMIVLDQSESTEISNILQIFTLPDRKKLLSAEDMEGNNALYYILRSKGSSEISWHLCITLGTDWCLKALLHKNNKGNSAFVQAFLGDHGFDVSAFLEEFTDLDLQTIANDKMAHGGSTLVYALKASLPLAKLCFDKLGKKQCVDLIIQPDFKGNSGIVTAMQSGADVREIFSYFGADDEQLIAMLLAAQDCTGKSLIYHMIMDANTSTMDTLVACIMEIYTVVGEKKCTNILAGAIESNGSPQFIERFPRFDLFTELDAFVKLLEGLYKSGNEHESDGYLNQLITISNTERQFRAALAGYIERNESEFPQNWKLIQSKIKWVRRQVQKNSYFLLTQPSILLISNSRGRPGADEEMTSLIIALSVLDLEVTTITDLSKKDTLANIRQMQQLESSQQCQIVIMMSHGEAGHILDNNGCRIPVEELENAMCPLSHTKSPKVLILQCCQNEGDATLAPNFPVGRIVRETDASRYHEDAGASPSQPRNVQAMGTTERFTYAPTNANFCAIMSCVRGQVSYRNEYMPKLGEAIQNLQEDENLSSAYKAAHRALDIKQTPIFQTTMEYDVHLKSVYIPEDISASEQKSGCVLS